MSASKAHPRIGQVVGRGVYSAAEAARLTRVRAQKVREWFQGRRSASRCRKPVLASDYPVLDQEFAISFLDLIELKIAGSLREMGVSLPYVRKVYAQLQQEFGDHPFCTRQIYVGGKKIFTRGLNELESRSVLEAITNQGYFDSIILPFLKRVDYDDRTDRAIRWRIEDGVIIDPAINFGKPVIDGTRISTAILRNAYHANGEDADLVANWYGLNPRQVLAAVAFENELAA